MVGGRNILKHMNAQLRPLNTLDQPSTVGSSSDAPPAKRQRVNPSTSPYFTQSSYGDTQISDNSSSHECFKSNSSVGMTSPRLQSSFMQPKFKSNASKKRSRRARSAKENSHVSVSPGSDDRESAAGSSDILTHHPPPANVVSDLRAYQQWPTASREPAKTSYKIQKPARPAEQATESEDELISDPIGKRRTNFDKFVDKPRNAASRGDIPRTLFRKPLESRATLPQKPVIIGVTRAAANNYFCESEQGRPPVQLRLLETQGKFGRKSVFKSANSEQPALTWLEVDIGTINNLKSSARCLIINRPVSKLFLELDTVQDCKVFLSLIPPEKVIHNEHEDIDSIFDRNFGIIKKSAQSCIQPSETTQPEQAKDHGTPWSTTEAKFALDVRPVTRSARLVDQMQLGSSPTAEKKAIVQRGRPEVVRPANTTPLLRRTRSSLSTANSSLATAAVINSILDRWTRRNPAWRERWERSLMYPATGKNRTTVDDDDIPRLDEGEFLNDNLISFYLRYLEIKLEDKQPGLREKVYIFSTFFFEKLRSTRGKINYDGVKAWTAKFDLFSYDYIIVPVNEHAHWYLAIICNVPNALNGIPAKDDIEVIEVPEEPVTSSAASPCTMTVAAKPSDEAVQNSNLRQPKIITLDSLGSQHPSTIKALKEYLVEEAKDKKSIDLTIMPNGMKAKDVPMQNNFCDCGLFVLGYVEEFLKDPDGNARKLLQRENLGWEMQPSGLRNRIRELLFDLQNQQRSRLIKEKAQKQRSLPSRKAAQGKKQAATESAAASASVDVDASSDTERGTGTAVQQATLTLMQRSDSESSPCVLDDGPPVEDKLNYVETLSDSSGSTSTTRDIHHSVQTSPGGRPQKKGRASVAANSAVGGESIRSKKGSVLTEQLPLIRTLSNSPPPTVRTDDALRCLERLVPSVETASTVTSSLGRKGGGEVTLSGPGGVAEALLSIGSRAGYGGIDRSVDLT